jgi:hypothetical protein
MNKKAQGMSMEFIIKIVLALLAAGVLLFIFAGKAQLFSKAASAECTAQGYIKAHTFGCSEGETLRDVKLKDNLKVNDKTIKKGEYVKCCVKN